MRYASLSDSRCDLFSSRVISPRKSGKYSSEKLKTYFSSPAAMKKKKLTQMYVPTNDPFKRVFEVRVNWDTVSLLFWHKERILTLSSKTACQNVTQFTGICNDSLERVNVSFSRERRILYPQIHPSEKKVSISREFDIKYSRVWFAGPGWNHYNEGRGKILEIFHFERPWKCCSRGENIFPPWTSRHYHVGGFKGALNWVLIILRHWRLSEQFFQLDCLGENQAWQTNTFPNPFKLNRLWSPC